MNLRYLSLSALLVLGFSSADAAAPEPELIFNATAPGNNLKGDLQAQVLFAQSQIIPARPRG
jgi:hypothetical protein